MKLPSTGIATIALLIAGVATCQAQAKPPFVARDVPTKGSVELSGGGVYQGGTDIANQDATLTRNPTTGTGALQLFNADSSLAAGFGFQGRVGYYISRAISIEGGVQVARPEMRVRLSDDFESAAPTVATESITSYLFTGSLLYHLRNGKSVRPFLMGGAGHIRDLHDGDEVVETGVEYHAGGGFKSWFGRGRRKWGIRGDVLVSIRDGGVGGEEDRRTVPTATFSVSYVY